MADDGQKIMMDAHFSAALDAGKQQSNSYNSEIAQPAISTPAGTAEMPYTTSEDLFRHEVATRPEPEPGPLPEPDFER